jgi:hypothetical protein
VISTNEDVDVHRTLITDQLFNSTDLSSSSSESIPSEPVVLSTEPAVGGDGGIIDVVSDSDSDTGISPSTSSTAPTPIPPRRSSRPKAPIPSRYVTDAILTIHQASLAVLTHSVNFATSAYQSMYHALVADARPVASRTPVPNNIHEATNPSFPLYYEWMQAVQHEINSLVENKTLTVLRRNDPTLSGTRMLPGVKWVFKLKEDQHGNPVRFKARCTALGNLQKAGIDYEETFAPVVRFSTVRMLLALAASKKMLVHQMDVDTAFLYGEMSDEPTVCIPVPELYPIPPELQHISRDQLGCRIDKSLYGLKQSPRLWNKHIDRTMAMLGFTKSLMDPCLYFRTNADGDELYVTVYVDDLIIAGTNLEVITAFKGELCAVYSMKDLGDLKYCLGMEITRDSTSGNITLSQTKYIDDICRRFRVSSCKPVNTPMQSDTRLSKQDAPLTPAESAEAEKFPYREIIGSVMYLMTCTRPDIAFAVGHLASFMNCHGPKHHKAAIHLLKYLHTTRLHGLTYGRDTRPIHLTGYSDSDWGSHRDTSRSTSGYIFYIAGGPISWKSKLQPTVALSSTEAEYMALTLAAQEAIALRGLLAEFTGINESVQMYGDNQSSIAMSRNPTSHQASKHIAIRHHFVREKVTQGDIILSYMPTGLMVADALTKPLPLPTFARLCPAIRGIVLHGSSYPSES